VSLPGRVERNLQTNDEILFKLRLRRLAEKIVVDAENKIQIADTAFPSEDCLILPKVHGTRGLKSKKKPGKARKLKKTGKQCRVELGQSLEDEILDYYDQGPALKVKLNGS
jgi:hypothetical protein